jgi:mannitol 2-dehydrogenase
MGYLGYLAGYRSIHEIARAPEFRPYLEGLMADEVTPLLDPVPGVDLVDYRRSLLHRFSNEAIRDQTLRICLDGSSKLPQFVFPSIREALERGGPIQKLTLCVASWIRFLAGTDDAGDEIPIDDPQAERLTAVVRSKGRDPLPLLRLEDLFGDLGQSERFVTELRALVEMLYERGPRETLRYCSG